MVKVSVVISVLNGEKVIKRCLDSVLAQTLKEIEIIVINDGSTDGTDDIIKQYINNHKTIIKYKKLEKNVGLASARNIANEIVDGKYVTYVDADDSIHNEMLEKLYLKAEEDNSDIIICDTLEIRGDNKKVLKNVVDKDNLKKSAIINSPRTM